MKVKNRRKNQSYGLIFLLIDDKLTIRRKIIMGIIMSKKTRNILIVLYVIAFFITCIGAAFAYFTVIKVSTVSKETDISSATMTSIIFDAGSPIAIYANEFNFGEGMNDLSGATYASSTLKVGSADESASFRYNLSIEFFENTMLYSSYTKTPEVLLSLFDPNGNEITKLEGLEYVTVGENKGFDVTGKTGEYLIASNYEITTTSEITQKWDVKLTFVNLETSQDINKGKGLNGALKIDPIY